MKKGLFIFLVISILWPAIALAGGWTGFVTIQKIYRYTTVLLIKPSQSIATNPDNCSSTNYIAIQMDESKLDANQLAINQEMERMAEITFFENTYMNFYVSGCLENCPQAIKYSVGKTP